MPSTPTSKISREQAALTRIGERIRSTRRRRRMTLDDLARASGLSITFLSRLERGRVACSIGNLLEIAGVLELAPGALFDDPSGAAANNFRIVRAGAATEMGASDVDRYRWQKLASGRGEQRIEAFDLTLGCGSRGAPLVAHPGEEFCFVLDGRVEFQIGVVVVELAAGDSIHLRSDVPHMAWSSGSSTARLLMVTAIENQSATAVEWWSEHQLTNRAPATRRRSNSDSGANEPEIMSTQKKE